MTRPPDASPVAVTLPELIRLAGPAAASSLGRPRRESRLQGGTVGRLRGRGMEYAESRPYQTGDDPRSIDWRVTARTGRAYTKLFREEREHPLLLSVDLRPAMFFATEGVFKAVLAARAAALLAWAAVQRGERVGLQLLTAEGLSSRRPGRGRRAALGICRALADAHGIPAVRPSPGASPRVAPPPAARGGPALTAALADLAAVTRPGARLAVIGDFHDLDEAGTRRLGELARHAEVLTLLIHDRLEAQLPPPGRYRVLSARGEAVLDARSDQAAALQRRVFGARLARLQRVAALPSAETLVCHTGQDVVSLLQRRAAPLRTVPSALARPPGAAGGR